LVKTTGVDKTSHRLRASNYGFSIPTGATITGILVEVYDNTTVDGAGDGCYDASVQLLIAGSETGTDKATFTYQTPVGWKSYGSSSDLWGLTPTVAQINASGFGVSVKYGNASALATETISVDSVRITITYTLNGNASGSIPTLTLSVPTATERGDGNAAGAMNTLTLGALDAVATGDATTTAPIDTLTLTPISGSALFIPPPSGQIPGRTIAGQFVKPISGSTSTRVAGQVASSAQGHSARGGPGSIPRRTP
jgi:hypothetical protein